MNNTTNTTGFITETDITTLTNTPETLFLIFIIGLSLYLMTRDSILKYIGSFMLLAIGLMMMQNILIIGILLTIIAILSWFTWKENMH